MNTPIKNPEQDVTHAEFVESLVVSIARHYLAVRPSDYQMISDMRHFEGAFVNLGVTRTEYMLLVEAAMKRAGNRPLARRIHALYLSAVRAED